MASVEKRQTTRGPRYDVRYREPGGRPRTKTFRRRADADRFARAVEVEKDRGLFVDPSKARTPLAEVAALWLDSNPAKRSGSWERDERIVRGHIVPALGERPVGSISPSDVQRTVNHWARSLAPRTVARQYGVLRAILNYAVSTEMLGRNPCRRIKLPEVTPLGPRHVVTAAELQSLATGLGGVGRLGPMAYLGTVEGMRWGEVAGLRVGQVDVSGFTLTVAETVVRRSGSGVGFGEPKSRAGRRTLPVPAGLMKMLVEHMTARGLTARDTESLLFTAPEGGPLRYSNWLRRCWYPAAVAAGLGRMVEDEETGKPKYVGLAFHDLRRAHATGLVAAGVDVKTAQTLLGHSDSRLTLELYAQVVPELSVAAAQAMEARFVLPARDERAMESSGGDEDERGDVTGEAMTSEDDERPR